MTSFSHTCSLALDSLIFFLYPANLNPSFLNSNVLFPQFFSTGLGHKGSDAQHINLWNIIGSLKYKT